MWTRGGQGQGQGGGEGLGFRVQWRHWKPQHTQVRVARVTHLRKPAADTPVPPLRICRTADAPPTVAMLPRCRYVKGAEGSNLPLPCESTEGLGLRGLEFSHLQVHQGFRLEGLGFRV